MVGSCWIPTSQLPSLPRTLRCKGSWQPLHEVFVPAIVLGELYYGAYKSTRVTENLLKIDEFATTGTILVSDKRTAREYGEIKSRLRAKGRPIPENDIWIAAIAKQHVLTLVTRDAHFGEVDGLAVEGW